jgi:dihydroorotase-like cyclic amidohydrolase
MKYILESQDFDKGDIESESRAAVAGGITSLLSNPTRFLMLLPKKFLNNTISCR